MFGNVNFKVRLMDIMGYRLIEKREIERLEIIPL